MKNISFESIEDLCLHMADSYDSIKGEDSEDVAVIAKYPEMREIIKELLCIGYDLHSCDIEDEDYDGYCDEYICTIYDNQLWIEKMMRKNGYLTDDSNVIYLLDNCSSKVIPQITSKNIFEVSICDNDDSECDGDCENCDLHETEFDTDDGYHITVKANLDADEALATIKEMESRMNHMFEMFDEMTNFKKLLNW